MTNIQRCQKSFSSNVVMIKITSLAVFAKTLNVTALKTQAADLFKKVRLLFRQFKLKTWIIEDEDGTPLQGLGAVTSRCQSYFEFYRSPNGQMSTRVSVKISHK